MQDSVLWSGRSLPVCVAWNGTSASLLILPPSLDVVLLQMKPATPHEGSELGIHMVLRSGA